MLLHQVLEELSIYPPSEAQDKSRGKEDAHLARHEQQIIDDVSVCGDYNLPKTCGNHERLVGTTAACSMRFPLSRHNRATNSQYLYKAAIAAKEIQVAGHGRISAPAILANCLLSMISFNDDDDDEDATGKFENGSSFMKNEGRKTLLKSFSQLRAEERDGENVGRHNSHTDLYKKLQFTTCCLFPSIRRSISSKTIGSALELLSNSDELSSSNEDLVVGCRSRANAEGGSVLRSFLKKVFGKRSPEAGTGCRTEDCKHAFDECWAPSTTISTQRHFHKKVSDLNNEDGISSTYHYEETVMNGYCDSLQVGKGRSAFKSDLYGAVPKEVVHEVMPFSHDAPVSSSFVFEHSCFSACSSTSSTSYSMKMESAHPWLIPGEDQNFCTTSACSNEPINHLLQRVVQDDPLLRLANKRLNLSR